MDHRRGSTASRIARAAGAFLLTAALGLFTADSARAQEGGGVHIGPQINLASDTDVGIGGRISGDLSGYPGWELLGSFDVYFPDGNYDFWELNGNVAYNIDAQSTTVFPYVGGGLNIAHVDLDDGGPGDGDRSDTDLGLNVLGGLKFATDGPLTPYLELRGTIEGSDQLVFTAGILFP